MKLIIPFLPISINEAYAGYPKRHKSNKYKQFERDIETYFNGLDEVYEITGDEWLEIRYTFYLPLYYKNGKKKKQDLFNFEKVLSDVLSHHIKGFKDENIKIGKLIKIDHNNPKMEIEILEIN